MGEEQEMCIYGGYKTQTVAQLAHLLSAYDEGSIGVGGVRVYLSALLAVASREAAKRSQRRGGRGHTPRYRMEELQGLSNLPLTMVKKELRRLRKAGLLSFTETGIEFSKIEHPESADLSTALSGGRSSRRPVPLPRPLLRLLSRSNRGAFIKVAIAYAIRGLSLSKRGGEIKNSGSVKATFIGEIMGLSERAVRGARKELISIGFISKDTGSHQRKLNRTGAYFSVNLSWRYSATEKGGDKEPVKIAPPGVKKRGDFAPPYKTKKTLFRSNNQETFGAPQTAPSGGKNLEVDIRDIKRKDLEQFSRTEELYRQAIKVGYLRDSESAFLNFIGAAIRAKTVAVRDPVRVFVSIVKRGAWGLISQEQEDRARTAIKKYRPEGGYLGA